MPNEVKLLPTVDEVLRAYESGEMDAAGIIEDLVAIIDSRPTTAVTDEVVERVKALEAALERLQDAADDYRLDPGQPAKATELALAQAAARAILYTPSSVSMPTVVIGER